ncbi:hypothetical protein GCM10018785_63590 [Streptomyces longispororuber]|uniref:Uncharacterized protein n=1 Tax=Streptomyces longispororuber TaxID=68230 RepID=A0A919A657_9ACTN|nr:hypothetical protein [Streptomyces longispororuber]GHE87230.1 hypothetical protein GCM10018785_63590 [Streptomyces longispororuber]
MGVVDSQWWDLWWPWMVVWLATAACCGVLLRYVLLRLGLPRRRRPGRRRRTFHGMCFYLHEQRVMDLYQTGGFSAALEQEVADRTNVTSGVGLWAKVTGGVGGKAGRDVTKERFTTYVQQNTPITVIGLLMDTMRREDAVVHADLTTGVLTPNRALADALRDSGDDRVPLSAVMAEFVSVTGRFTARGLNGGDVVLRARYGDGTPQAHVKITCVGDGIREEFHEEDYFSGEFQARCLGKVRTWNREAGELTVDPVAIFR